MMVAYPVYKWVKFLLKMMCGGFSRYKEIQVLIIVSVQCSAASKKMLDSGLSSCSWL